MSPSPKNALFKVWLNSAILFCRMTSMTFTGKQLNGHWTISDQKNFKLM